MKKFQGICLSLAIVIIFTAENSSFSAVRRILGPNITMSWASTYLAIESGSITVQNNPTWNSAFAPGWFFDYMITPYISLRTNWFFYPTSLNNNLKNFDKTNGQIPLHELGFSVLRHFDAGVLNPWFGAGPFVQFATPDDINSYIIHAVLSLGFDYEVSEDVYFCPELMGGLGARLISRGTDENVKIDVPTGRGFSSSGIVIFLKIGVGKAF